MLDALRWGALLVLGVPYLWVRTRFTPAGWLAVSALLVSALLGLDTNGNTAHRAFTFLAALLGVSLLCAPLFRARLSVERRLPRFGTAGEPLPYRVAVRNEGGGRLSGLRLREDLLAPFPSLAEFRREPQPPGTSFGERLSGYARWRAHLRARRLAEGAPKELPELPPGASCEADLELLPLRRGRLRLSALDCERPDPLGLFLARVRGPAEQSVLILPRRYPVPNPALPGSRRHQPGGVALASSVGDSSEFVSLREYRPGDPPRRVHWRSAARAGELLVREYHDEYFVRHALVLDTFVPAGAEPLFEEAVSVAASYACAVLTQESLLDLLFIGADAYCFTAGRGLGGTERMLEILACAQPCRERPFAELRAAVARRFALLSGCIPVLLGLDAERRAFVRELRGLGVPVSAFALLRPGEAPEPEPGVRFLEAGRIAQGLAC